MDAELVRYSRAGDAFHYRWAARRSLRLIDPHSSLKRITVEGSKEATSAGEFIIDLAEYSEVAGRQSIAYFQLKHTTVQKNKAFALGEMAKTLSAFAKRYSVLILKPKQSTSNDSVTFSFVTNRPISKTLKQAIVANAGGFKANRRFQNRLQRITGLRGKQLQAFCASLSMEDGEGDYVVQKRRLKTQMSEYMAGFVDSREVDALIAMVADRALPKSEDGRVNGEIYREDVLQRLGASSERDLFPAPTEFEQLTRVIKREQHNDIQSHINTATGPMIIHAAGGVGKSVVARQLAQSLPKGSQGFIYDCFGGGKYRNPSEPRHRACDALVQLSNEMAAQGLCQPVIGHAGVAADAIFRAFLARLKQAVVCLREIVPNAFLVLFIDAADNAELEAAERGDKCFAHDLLREALPVGCRLVMFCRTERIGLLKPGTATEQYELRPFSKSETAAHLRQACTSASEHDCLEFHRLTGGNPRVQANALAYGKNVSEVLSQLGPGQTVAAQIASQLASAISAVKERHVEQAQVDAICYGLANLPPFVPIDVLAQAAQVDASAVRSFISDLGRPLWQTDDAVQFRDEPTETWFRDTFSASKTQIFAYVTALEPLARQHNYVAKALPQLLLRSENYDRLLELALSDDLLPENNAVDERDIRFYRLQFAFKAALKLGRYADAARVAFRAGEEAAGNERQLSLLQANLHLIEPLQGAHRIQEIAYRRLFGSAWTGSQNVYSASLLSTVKDFHGEARTYLRAARRWLQIYFEEREKQKKIKKDPPTFDQDQLQDVDIAELGWAYLNLHGPSEAVEFLLSWRPPEFTFRVTRLLIRRLVDAGRFAEIDRIAELGAKSIYLELAVADELMEVAHFPPKRALRRSLGLLAIKATRIPKPPLFSVEDKITPAILSLAEASVARGLSSAQVRAVVTFYGIAVTDGSIGGNGQRESRRAYFRGVALKAVLDSKQALTPDSLLPQTKAKKPRKGTRQLDEREVREITECIQVLSPWYILRARVLAARANVGRDEVEQAIELSEKALRGRYRTYDPLPWEISRLRFELLALNTMSKSGDIGAFIDFLKATDSYSLQDRLNAARTVFRMSHLAELCQPLEVSSRETILAPGNEGPDERASWFTSLARAVLPSSTADAAAYFNDGVEAVSKFGDEMVERWEAVVATAKRASDGGRASPEIAYRFIRCAEMVGETVAREKYWDRDEVFQVAAHLDAPSAFAALSRWRDRGVGYFDQQLGTLAIEAVERKILAPNIAWCLSGFEGCNASVEFAAICLQHEPAKSIQRHIWDTAIHDLELAGTSTKDLQRLNALATTSFPKAELNRLIEEYSSVADLSATSRDASPIQELMRSNADRPSSDACLDGLDLLTPEGLARSVERFRTSDPPREFEKFWKEVILQIPVGKEAQFMQLLISGAELDSYDIREAVSQIRVHWLNKAAVKKQWMSFLKSVGKRLAIALSTRGSLRYFQVSSHLNELEVAKIKDGLIEGLAESSELMDAGTFFGFIDRVIDRLSTDEAGSLVEFALTRFEIHIDHDYADGLWAEWLRPPADVPGAVVGLIWSALGSPYSSIRWQAAHCVGRLVGNSCENEIASLIGWMKTSGVGPFGSHRFPFYEFHAKLHLLFALARAAVDDPTLLKPHAKVFSQIALDGTPHILIQKVSADIAIAIEKKFPRTYKNGLIVKLRQVGVSTLPAYETKTYQHQVTTPWHADGQLKPTSSLYFGYDFDRYWFAPLGQVFGISEAQITEFAGDNAINYLGIQNNDTSRKDPRHGQWENLNRFEGGFHTWHDHGSYPRVDDYTFYYSYHAVFISAARLLSNMRVIRYVNDGYEEDRWLEWLSRHWLMRSDRRWLADRRDATPVCRRAWVESREREHWEWSTRADDFLEILRQRSSLPGSLCVSGHWMECDSSYEEDIHVSSALVDRSDANSVANTLRKSDETNWSALPQFGDEDSVPGTPSAKLTGWIRQDHYREQKLDGFDPYARDIHYPPREIGERFASLLSLSPDSDRRKWRLPNATEPAIICEVWSDRLPNRTDEQHGFGERIQASVELLKTLCKKTQKDLIFDVRIKRQLDRRYSSADKEATYVPPSRKIFVLSSDGVLRDKQSQYQLV